MSERSKLNKLYAKIPSFKCIEGCNDCCGPVPIKDVEARNLGITENMLPYDHELNCSYISKKDSSCTVYENRPFMCRLFGTIKELKCPHDKKPIKFIPKDKHTIIVSSYHKLTGGLPRFEEIVDVNKLNGDL